MLEIGMRACVGISKKRSQEFQGKDIEILEAKFMLEELLSLIRKQKKKGRKGAHLEPLIWLLQTVDNAGKSQR